jgi:CheY-like chemotaxis protein
MRYHNVLLVDDDIDDQEIFLMALETITPAVTCTIAGSGHEALKKLHEAQTQPDVIFMDLNMPLMSGEQVLKELKQHERLQQIPVIIFSTSANPATIQQTRNMGAHDFITKPNSFNELTSLLGSIFAVAVQK